MFGHLMGLLESDSGEETGWQMPKGKFDLVFQFCLSKPQQYYIYYHVRAR